MDNCNRTDSIFRSNQFKIFGLVFAVGVLWQMRKSYFYWGSDVLVLFCAVYSVLLAFPTYLFFARNQLVVSSENVKYSIFGKQHQITWNETQRIEIDKKSHRAVLFGNGGKRLAIFGLNYFSGFEALLVSEAQKHNIIIEKTERAAYLESKNTAVS